MKTTVDLPDDLLIAAKKRAAETRSTLRALLERGLRRELAGPRPHARGRHRALRWVKVDGGLPAGMDLTDRAAMHDWLARNRA
jgi:hypothetical protein